MKVIVSDPISNEGLEIFRKNGIEVIDAVESEIDENYEHVSSANGWVIRSGTTLDAKLISKINYKEYKFLRMRFCHARDWNFDSAVVPQILSSFISYDSCFIRLCW